MIVWINSLVELQILIIGFINTLTVIALLFLIITYKGEYRLVTFSYSGCIFYSMYIDGSKHTYADNLFGCG
jgi:putative membrane protein